MVKCKVGTPVTWVSQACGYTKEKTGKVVGMDLGFHFNEDEMVTIDLRSSRVGRLPIPADAIEDMAVSAMKVTRLLQNNPREITAADARHIYQNAY